MRVMRFTGQSGREYEFVRLAANGPWARAAGVALFAAQGPYGWRVVRLAALRGRLHDVQPIWAFADAERYGARAIFVMQESDPQARVNAIRDLEAGLSPVCATEPSSLALAA